MFVVVLECSLLSSPDQPNMYVTLCMYTYINKNATNMKKLTTYESARNISLICPSISPRSSFIKDIEDAIIIT